MVERSANGCEELPENVADRNPVNVSLQRHLLLPVAQITNWAHSAELEFAPADLAIENLQRLQKDWKIQWTSKLSWHLHMIDYTIFVYWPATPFIESELPDSLSLQELECTYGFLFSTTSAELQGHRNQMRRLVPSITVDNFPMLPPTEQEDLESSGTTNIPLTPLLGTFRELLINFLSTPAPGELVEYDKLIHTADSETPTIMDLASSSSPFRFSRFLVPIRGVLRYPTNSKTEKFSNFPYFEKKLRALVETHRRQTNTGALGLWRGLRGDYKGTGFLVFWLLLVIGVIGGVRFRLWDRRSLGRRNRSNN